MDRQATDERIRELIDPFNKKNVEVSDSTTFAEDLELDSLSVMDFVAAIEDEFDIIIYATGFDAITGEVRYSERLTANASEGVTASPVSDGRNLFFTSELGNVYVVPAAGKFSIAAKNSLGETCLSTPAISDGALFFRTREMGEMTFRYFEAFAAATLVYVTIAMTANRVMALVERRVAVPGFIAGGGK